MNIQDIKTIRDIQELPEAILVDIDYDVLHILVSTGVIFLEDYEDEYNNPDAWDKFYAQDYHGLFVLLDDSGADYRAVWGYSGSVPYLEKSLDLLWFEGNLVV